MRKELYSHLDIIDLKVANLGNFKQFDSLTLKLEIRNNQNFIDLTDNTVKLKFYRQKDKKIFIQTDGITIKNSIITIALNSSALALDGVTYFEIEIKDPSGSISTATFQLVVKESISAEGADIPEEDKGILDKLITTKYDDVTYENNILSFYANNKKIKSVEIISNPTMDKEFWRPSVNAEGLISWEKSASLEIPLPQNIKGPRGEKGLQGEQGPEGPTGTTNYNELINKPNLNVYSLKTETYTKSESDNLLADKANKITTYTKAEVDKKISDSVTGGNVDLSNYYTKTESDNKFSLTSHNHNTLYYLKPDVYTKSESNDLLSEKADKSNVYTYLEINNLLKLKSDIATTYTKVEVDKKITDAITGGSVDLSNYYTKLETDNKFATKTSIQDFITLQQLEVLKPTLKGEKGDTGANGRDGANGTTFTPTVSSEGVISWTNNGNLSNPSSINIKGPKGDKGDTGSQGLKGDTGATGTFNPSTEFSNLTTQNKTVIGAINEVNAKPSGGSSGRVIPLASSTPSEYEIFMVIGEGANFNLTNAKNATITGNDFTIDAADGEVYVEFTSNGSLEVECTKRGTGYYMMTSDTGIPDTGWKSDLKGYVFTGKVGQRIKVLANNVGWGFTVRTKALSELCFNSQLGIKKIAFEQPSTVRYQNQINSEVEQLKKEIQSLKIALYQASVLPVSKENNKDK